MRLLLLGDIIAAARVLLVLPPAERIAAMARMIDQTHAAHQFHKRLTRPHPLWGNGSLMVRANLAPQCPEPFSSDPEYLLALQLVVDRLILWKNRNSNPG